ncbi:MAG: SIR2 family protein [Segetibacter sp.]
MAQIYFNQRKQKEFVDIVREVLQHKQARYNGLHEAIFDLKPHHIVSTNFDDLLEQVIQSKAFLFSIIKSDNDFPYAASLSYLVKMHGDLNDTEFILKEDDFLDYQNKHPLFEAFIKSVFATQVVLFIGYSFSDLDLKIIINRVRNILGNDFQYAFLLSADKDFSESQRDYLKNKGIIAINYFDAQVDSEQNYIDNYLYQGKNAKNIKHRRNINGLSTKGANLKSLIDFIVHYDSYSQDLLREDILVQIDKSLYRFNELTSLYPEFISNLFPFNINAGSYLHSRNDISIKTNNPDIILKLKDYTIIENNIRQLKTNIINRKASNDEEVLLFKILREPSFQFSL